MGKFIFCAVLYQACISSIIQASVPKTLLLYSRLGFSYKEEAQILGCVP